MNWKHWKIGLMVACFSGLLTALAAAMAFDKIIPWKFSLFILGSMAQSGLLYLKQNPVEKISEDSVTVSTKKTDDGVNQQTTTTVEKTTSEPSP